MKKDRQILKHSRKKNPDLFKPVEKIGNGYWQLRDWKPNWIVYERNAEARRKCIEHHGVSCKVCGFDFEKKFGKFGKGFIHVHHVKPLSEITQGYNVDPENDLIPLSPNCHAMIHRGKSALSIRGLKEILEKTT